MPAPERTSLDAIVEAAGVLLDEHGPDRLTMKAVADRVGVRAPSLYKRVDDRDALLTLVAAVTAERLGEDLRAASGGAGDDPRERIVAMASAARDFARAHPARYRLVFDVDAVADPDRDALSHAVAPLFEAAADLVGEEAALDAARTVTAWTHGFVLMELTGAFRLGGDIDSAFQRGASWIAGALGR